MDGGVTVGGVPQRIDVIDVVLDEGWNVIFSRRGDLWYQTVLDDRGVISFKNRKVPLDEVLEWIGRGAGHAVDGA